MLPRTPKKRLALRAGSLAVVLFSLVAICCTRRGNSPDAGSSASDAGGILAGGTAAPTLHEQGLLFSASAPGIYITQSTLGATDASSGDSGYPTTLQAENGQTTTADGGDGGNGAVLYLGGGNGGTGPNANGLAAGVCLDVGDASVLCLTDGGTLLPTTDNAVVFGSTTQRIGGLFSGGPVEVYFDGGTGGDLGFAMMSSVYNATLGGVSGVFSAAPGSASLGSTWPGQINWVGYGATWLAVDSYGTQSMQVGANYYNSLNGEVILGTPSLVYQPAFASNAANSSITFFATAQSAAGSGAGLVGGSYLNGFAQAGQATTANAAAGGAGGAAETWAGGGGLNLGAGVASNGGAGGEEMGWGGDGGLSGKGGVGGAGGRAGDIAGHGGPGDAGGAGGNWNGFAGAGGLGDAGGASGSAYLGTFAPFAGKTSTGANGAIVFYANATAVSAAGVPSGGTSLLNWQTTPDFKHSSVTLGVSGTTTLTAAQLLTMVLDIAVVTTTANTTLDFGNVEGIWLLNVSNITLGATYSFSLKSGTATAPASCPAITTVPSTTMLWLVETTGSNGIVCNQ